MTAYKTLYRSIGLPEWRLIIADGKKRFPPEMLTANVFYPTLQFAYACKLASDLNTRNEFAEYVGLVVAFDVPPETFAQYDEFANIDEVIADKLWIPAAEIMTMNQTISGLLRVVETFYGVTYNDEKFTPQELNEVGFL